MQRSVTGQADYIHSNTLNMLSVICYNCTMNELKRLKEFKKALADYHISDASKKILHQTKLVLLAAPTSAGRNTIIRDLLKTNDYHYIISDTTRKPRVNDGIPEQDGVTYWFRSEADMLQDLEAGRFLEAAIIHNQQVSGISIREFKRARDEKKIAITDIEIVGVHTIMDAKPDAIALFILPPSFDEWQRRVKGRGDMSRDEYRRRMHSAAKELNTALEQPYYTFVINDRVENAVSRIHTITQLGHQDAKHHASGRKLAQSLYMQTAELL